MKSNIWLLFVGIAVSYCFTSMVLNGRVVSPLSAFTTKPLTIDKQELYAGLKDYEIISDNILRPLSDDAWIEITGVRERVGELRTVIYKGKPFEALSLGNTVLISLYYADAEQEYHEYRKIVERYNGDATVFIIPHYAGAIDKVYLSFAVGGTALEIKEISLNSDTQFSFLIYGLIYIIWLAIVFLEPHRAAIQQ